MSLLGNIEHLAVANGIESVAVNVDEGARDFRGDEGWRNVLEGALELFSKTQETSIRLVIGKHTVVVQRENHEVVGVVLPTGHAIAKSLRRMIRRMAKKDRGPVVQRPVAAAAAPAPVATPLSSQPMSTPAAAPVSSPSPYDSGTFRQGF